MTEIYSATLIDAFQSQLITLAILFGLSIISIPGIFRRGASTVSRIVIGVLVLILIIADLVMAAITFYQYTNGAETITAALARKQVIQTNAPDNQGTNTTYHLSFPPATEFDVPKDAYDKVTEKTCYQVTFYPSRGLLALFGQGSESPIKTGAVSSIKQPPSNQCR